MPHSIEMLIQNPPMVLASGTKTAVLVYSEQFRSENNRASHPSPLLATKLAHPAGAGRL